MPESLHPIHTSTFQHPAPSALSPLHMPSTATHPYRPSTNIYIPALAVLCNAVHCHRNEHRCALPRGRGNLALAYSICLSFTLPSLRAEYIQWLNSRALPTHLRTVRPQVRPSTRADPQPTRKADMVNPSLPPPFHHRLGKGAPSRALLAADPGGLGAPKLLSGPPINRVPPCVPLPPPPSSSPSSPAASPSGRTGPRLKGAVPRSNPAISYSSCSKKWPQGPQHNGTSLSMMRKYWRGMTGLGHLRIITWGFMGQGEGAGFEEGREWMLRALSRPCVSAK